jgi:hypothetical protein
MTRRITQGALALCVGLSVVGAETTPPLQGVKTIQVDPTVCRAEASRRD